MSDSNRRLWCPGHCPQSAYNCTNTQVPIRGEWRNGKDVDSLWRKVGVCNPSDRSLGLLMQVQFAGTRVGKLPLDKKICPRVQTSKTTLKRE